MGPNLVIGAIMVVMVTVMGEGPRAPEVDFFFFPLSFFPSYYFLFFLVAMHDGGRDLRA